MTSATAESNCHAGILEFLSNTTCYTVTSDTCGYTNYLILKSLCVCIVSISIFFKSVIILPGSRLVISRIESIKKGILLGCSSNQ